MPGVADRTACSCLGPIGDACAASEKTERAASAALLREKTMMPYSERRRRLEEDGGDAAVCLPDRFISGRQRQPRALLISSSTLPWQDGSGGHWQEDQDAMLRCIDRPVPSTPDDSPCVRWSGGGNCRRPSLFCCLAENGRGLAYTASDTLIQLALYPPIQQSVFLGGGGFGDNRVTTPAVGVFFSPRGRKPIPGS